MDARPIGVFDSGLGGLTTVKKLAELLPGEDIIYLGDTGRVPYGSRSKETIIKYARQAADFLAGFDIKAMVIACNTASASAYDILERSYSIPIFEVVSAPAKAAAESTSNGKIGVIGTTATIRSGAYEEAIKKISDKLLVFSAACPLFVPLVENGRVASDDIAALTIAQDYLTELQNAGIDTLIMGCTHYPLLRGVISKIMGEGVTLIDSGAYTAVYVASDMQLREMKNVPVTGYTTAGSKIKYFVTDSIEGFSTLASIFMESDVNGAVEQITLE